MSNITDLSAYAEKCFREGYEYGLSEDADSYVAFAKGETFFRGYYRACLEISEREAERKAGFFRQGWDAYFRGEPKTACPYPPEESIEESNWVDGWEQKGGSAFPA
jgi:ribosome modulation factor